MIRVTILLVLLWVLGDSPLLAFSENQSLPPDIKISLASIIAGSLFWETHPAMEGPFEENRFLVQRGSTRPPGGSQSGRASGSVPGEKAGMTRDSSKAADFSQEESHENIIGDKKKAPRSSRSTFQKKHDPTKGGGRSPSGFDRRGGAR